MKKLFSLLVFCFSTALLTAQSMYWNPLNLRSLEGSSIRPFSYYAFQPDASSLLSQLKSAPAERQNPEGLAFSLPDPEGRAVRVQLWEVPVMAPALQLRYPSIRTYAGYVAGRPSARVRVDATPRGFHAMVLDPSGSWYIDPIEPELGSPHIAYFRNQLPAPKAGSFRCSLSGDPVPSLEERGTRRGPTPIGDELRVYRLAVSATGEYTQYHGGTVDGALAAIATTMNRVNGVYERDMALRMVLVENNDLIIFTDAATDPFTNGNEINQNQNVVDQNIGSQNYDIGHVFDRGGGGVASLRSVCDFDRKARGYTSLQVPEGDPFDIDYVSHELGHQYGGNHTQNNSCNRVSSAAFEPGSASTIMGYAGICAPNLQNNSDDYFHVHSLQEMIDFTVFGGGNGCAQIQPTGNTPPQIRIDTGGWVIPFSTPFELSGTATDLEGDSLTYCWEQYDLGPSTTPNNPIGNAPIFRSFKPTPDTFRVFPRINDILNETQTLGEILPTYSRGLTFRLSVRDNRGGMDWEELTFSVSDLAGPFEVTSQDAPTNWQGGAFYTVTWDVADTDEPPVSADSVSIFLSLDGGFTYPVVLAEKTPNDGSHLIRVPELDDSFTGRVKVKGYPNVFFNINQAPISIEPPSGPGFLSHADVENASTTCGADEVRIPLYVSTFGGFSDPISFAADGLPDAVSASFQPASVSETDTVQLILTGLGDLPPGALSFDLTLSSPTGSESLAVALPLNAPLGTPDVQSPSPGAVEVSTLTTLDWMPAANAETYRVILADNPDFEDPILLEEENDGNSFDPRGILQPNTTYYWSVAGQSDACGEGPSAAGSFTTEAHQCFTYDAEDVPITFSSATDFIQSDIEVPDSLIIRDVNLRGLDGSYAPNLSELTFLLRGPDGTEVELLRPECTSAGTFLIDLDEEAELRSSDCPLNRGNTLKPTGSLHPFDGLNAQGTWSLIIQDDGTIGGLRKWSLEICISDRTSRVEGLDASAGLDFAIFPNPATASIQIRVNLEREADLRFDLLDPLGRKLRQLDLGSWSAGTQQWRVDVSSLPSGLYWGRLYDLRGNRVEALPVQLVRP